MYLWDFSSGDGTLRGGASGIIGPVIVLFGDQSSVR
jgi:hypothetical protein